MSDALAEGLLFATPGLWSKERPCPYEVACIELALLAARRRVPLLSLGDLERRWGLSRRQVRRVIDVVAQDAIMMEHPWAADFRPDMRPDMRTGRTVAGWTLAGRNGRETSGERPGSGREAAPHARDPMSDADAESDADTQPSTPPPPPTMGGDGTKADEMTTPRPRPRRPNFGAPPQAPAPNIEPPPSGSFDHYAEPATLGEVWCEELASMPPELRGKPPGLFAAWDADLLAAGPVDAEEAIRALAALCRGTPTRAPRVFEWSDLCGQRARYGSAWREALAWRRMGASEPLLGRQHRKATEAVPLVGEGAPVPVGLTDRGWT